MGCADSNGFQPDFFNNIAAVAVVLMFTKVVMHRSRRGTEAKGFLATLHVITVILAGAAIAVSLWATGICTMDRSLHQAAWILLVATGVGLLVDVFIEDVGSVRGWDISKRDT
jgi:hypothetical protein